MKAILISVSLCAVTPYVQALDFPTPVNVPSVASSTPVVATAALRSDSDLDAMFGPIALYPDALIALILPASTAPANIVLAARHITANGSQATLAAQPWDESVKGLTHYPDVLRWLDQNLSWTQALGQSFATQPVDVMNAIQRLRAQARASGTLVDTPQQRVVLDNGSLVIVPAQPDVIYVPMYDPTVVYVPSSLRVTTSYVHFRSAYPSGPWLNYGFDWRQRRLRPVLYSQYPHSGHLNGYPSPHYPSSYNTRVWVTGSPNSPAYRPHPMQIYRPPVMPLRVQQSGQPALDIRRRDYNQLINRPYAPVDAQKPRLFDAPQGFPRPATTPVAVSPGTPSSPNPTTPDSPRNRPRTAP